MARIVPSAVRFQYGGMIHGEDYLAVVLVLDQVAEAVGIGLNDNVLVVDLPSKVEAALERATEIGHGLGFDEGREKAFSECADDCQFCDTVASSDDHESLDVQLSRARDDGYEEGWAACQAQHQLEPAMSSDPDETDARVDDDGAASGFGLQGVNLTDEEQDADAGSIRPARAKRGTSK